MNTNGQNRKHIVFDPACLASMKATIKHKEKKSQVYGALLDSITFINSV